MSEKYDGPGPTLGRMQALEAFEELEALLAKLARRMVEEDAQLPAYAVRLPFPRREPGEQKAPRLTVIQPEGLLGLEARRYAAEILQATRFVEEQHQQRVLRCPGLLAASPETMALLEQANAAKARFEEAYRAISPEPAVRKEQIGYVIKGICLLQTYRAIPVLTERPLKVGFVWAAHTPKIRRLTVAALREELEKVQQNPPEGVDPQRWEMDVGEDLVALRGLPDQEYLAVRQQIAPHPRINLYLPGQSGPSVSPASLPVCYPDDGSEALPPIRPLGLLDLRFRRAMRSDVKVEEEPVIAHRHVYRYKPEHRRQAPAAG